MAKTASQKFESLCKRLGELDAERRKVIKDLKSSPEYVTKYVTSILDAIIKNGTWYARKSQKGEAYFKLVTYNFNSKTPHITKTGSAVYTVTLDWEHFPVDATEKVNVSEVIEISAFNDLDKQVFGERTVATKFSEKDAVKKVLNARKAELETQLKKLKDEISAIK
jgi:hypothetical protein